MKHVNERRLLYNRLNPFTKCLLFTVSFGKKVRKKDNNQNAKIER